MTDTRQVEQASRLRAAAHEMLALADEIEQSYVIRASSLTVTETASRSALTAVAAKWSKDRNRRLDVFGSHLFGEPAWDMLLYLYCKAGQQERVLKTALTNASGSSHSTALRYVAALEEEGLIAIEKTESDNRVQLVSLTPEGLLRMSACIARSMRREHYGIDALTTAMSPRPQTPMQRAFENTTGPS